LSPVADATGHFKLEIKMSSISLAIPHEATQSRDRRSNVIFGVSVAIVLILLAILSVATGVAPTVDPVAFLSP
jgi:hypothetical protein